MATHHIMQSAWMLRRFSLTANSCCGYDSPLYQTSALTIEVEAPVCTPVCLHVKVITVRAQHRQLIYVDPSSQIQHLVHSLRSQYEPDSPSHRVLGGATFECATTNINERTIIAHLCQFGLTCIIVNFDAPPAPAGSSVTERINAFSVMMAASNSRSQIPDEAAGSASSTSGKTKVFNDLRAALLAHTEARFTSMECRSTSARKDSTATSILKTFTNVLWALDGQ